MEKKSFIILLIILVSIPIVVLSAFPQFLIFQGQVILDGRIASEAVINFSIEGTQIYSTTTNVAGEYGPILIQGLDENLYNQPIDITIDGNVAEQKINYTHPQDIRLDLSALTGNELRITESSPETEVITITKAQDVNFSISTETGYDNPVNYSVFVDGELESDTNSYIYSIENDNKGAHEIEIKISATDGFLIVSKEWTLIIARPETSNFDGSTTNFDKLGLDELENIPNVVIEKTGKGKIEFLQNLNLSGVTDLNDKVKIERGIVAINSSFYPQLNKPARITLTGLSYKTIPKIFYNNRFTTNPLLIKQECDFCNIISFTKFPTTNGEIVFEVEHFSSFRAGESGNKFDLITFSDLDTCKSGIIGNLNLDLKNPDEGDKFGPGEEIGIKVNVKNNADENKRIIVEAALYNIGENNIEKETDDEKKIKDGKKETFEMILKAPEDFEEDNYLVFVKAYEKGNEDLQCNQKAIGINLEREKHEVIIKEFSINPESIVAGKSFSVFAEVQNLGESDEDVYIVLEVNELGVRTKSETFELEEFGGKDSFSGIFSAQIPDSAEKGNYTLRIKTVSDGKEDEKTATISVLEKSPIKLKPINLAFKEPVNIEKKPTTVEKENLSVKTEIPLFVPILFSIGIIILIVLIAIVSRKR